MHDNPFASYNVTIPRRYADDVKKFTQTSGSRVTEMFAPFKRQVDFWYLAFIYAVHKSLKPESIDDSSNITPASILSTDPYRIIHIQLAFLGEFLDIDKLSDSKKVFDYAIQMANAGIPYILQMLKDQDARPLENILDFLEGEDS